MQSKKNKSKSTKKPAIRGKGDYNVSSSEFAQLQSKLDKIESKIPDAKGAITNIGGKLGGLLGSAELGRKAGGGLSKILGFGDYQIVSNSLVKSSGDGTLMPKFAKIGNNAIRVTEREYLGDVLSSAFIGMFKNQTFPLTPTSQRTFPWLSQIAKLFDQWEPHGIMFEFVSTSSDFNGSAQGLGSIIMATDYDATDPPFPNKRVMDNADYASSSKPSVNMLHGIECDPAQRPTKLLYNQGINDSVPTNLTTLGLFQVASSGVSAASVALGELWVSYDISFYKKQIDVTEAPMINFTGSNTSSSWSRPAIVVQNGVWKVHPEAEDDTWLAVEPPPNLYPVVYELQCFWLQGNAVGMPNVGDMTVNNVELNILRIATGAEQIITMRVTATGPNPAFRIHSKYNSAPNGFAISCVQVPSDFQF